MLKKFTYLAAVAFLVVGTIGFFPIGKDILGPISPSHNLLHLGTGIAALYVANQTRSLMAMFFNSFAGLYFAVAILGHIFNGNIFNLLRTYALTDRRKPGSDSRNFGEIIVNEFPNQGIE